MSRLKQNLVIACAGQKGGTGKSAVARTVAAERAGEGDQVVMVDLDVGQHTAADWVAAREANGFKPIVRAFVVDPDEEPDFRLQELAADFNLVLLDAPGFSDDRTLALAFVSDLVVVPSGPGPDDLRPTMRLVYELLDNGVEKDRIAVVLNRINTEADEKAARAYLAEGDIEAIGPSLRHLQVYRKAFDVGRGLTEYGKDDVREPAREMVKNSDQAGSQLAKKARRSPAEGSG